MAPFDPFDPNVLLDESDEIRSAPRIWLSPDRLGRSVIVDPIDYEWLMQWRWSAHINQKGRIYPARQEGSWRYDTRMRVYLHRAVLERAVGPPPSVLRYVADHINDDVFDARRKNLQWLTLSENYKKSAYYLKRYGNRIHV